MRLYSSWRMQTLCDRHQLKIENEYLAKGLLLKPVLCRCLETIDDMRN